MVLMVWLALLLPLLAGMLVGHPLPGRGGRLAEPLCRGG